ERSRIGVFRLPEVCSSSMAYKRVRKPASAKRRPRSHEMEGESMHLLTSILKGGDWVMRPYRPDYGLDVAIEVFGVLDQEIGRETMGEHFFGQLKSVEHLTPTTAVVYGRKNVAVVPLLQDHDKTAEISVARVELETSELVTVHRMGSG